MSNKAEQFDAGQRLAETVMKRGIVAVSKAVDAEPVKVLIHIHSGALWGVYADRPDAVKVVLQDDDNGEGPEEQNVQPLKGDECPLIRSPEDYGLKFRLAEKAGK